VIKDNKTYFRYLLIQKNEQHSNNHDLYILKLRVLFDVTDPYTETLVHLLNPEMI